MIRVLIADDHAIVREGVKRTLADAEDIEVVGEAGDGSELIKLIQRCEADAIVLDIAMPGTPGLDVIEILRQTKPDLPVLILSMYPAEQYAVRAIQAGASGFMNKASSPSELAAALRVVAKGRRYITPEVAETLATHVDVRANHPAHEALSNREFQVMCLIAEGKSVSDISKSLALSVKTVSTYRRRILDKLKLSQNAEITRYALRHGLVE